MTLTTEMPTQPSFQLPAGHHCLDLCSVLWTVHSPQVVLTLSWRNKSMMAHRYYPNLIQRIHCWIPSASTGLGKYLSNEWMNEWKNAFSLLPPPPHPNSLPSGLSTSAKDTAILLQSSKPKGGDLSLDTPSLMWLLKWLTTFFWFCLWPVFHAYPFLSKSELMNFLLLLFKTVLVTRNKIPT